MHDDFHYYAVRVLAYAAGMSDEDSHILATASQYVDDAREHRPIEVGTHLFDPVRTAYYGLRSFTWSVNKRIFIPFHFLPPKPLNGNSERYVTAADSVFSRLLLQEALKERDDEFRLVRLGVALHTYADTWAHQGFSGRRHKENDVTNIWIDEGVPDDSSWRKPFIRNLVFDLAPMVGHAEAGLLPDFGYLNWKYTRGTDRKVVERNNTEIFFDAALHIYNFLKQHKFLHSHNLIAWNKISKKILKCISNPERNETLRMEEWQKTFGAWFKEKKYKYKRDAWRKEAFYLKDLPQKDKKKLKKSIKQLDNLQRPHFPMKRNFFKSHWVLFHRAALRQRHFVLEHLL